MMHLTTFVVIAFPRVLYLCVSLTPSVHPPGNPCKRSHSVGVRRLILVSLVYVALLMPLELLDLSPPFCELG